MSKAAKQFQGDASGLLAVMRSPVAAKMTAFQSQSETNKKIISACVTRIEEVYGLVAERGPLLKQGRPAVFGQTLV
jgi:hypothetical protein